MSWTASTFLKQHLDILTPNPKNAAVFRGWITSEVIRVIRLCSNSTWAVLLWKEDVRIQWSIRKRLWQMDINKPTKERASEKIKAADTSISCLQNGERDNSFPLFKPLCLCSLVSAVPLFLHSPPGEYPAWSRRTVKYNFNYACNCYRKHLQISIYT